ncbi:hypothetical protein PhCBS80983_g02947 [Powellomyces hirtus]|uniref:Calcineurin-like phosphoesterase domain-containing protein n=1 Tax=Powellomyces hirtus TaxID=109895 RepID=A0A507E6F3_9FUNG|nr:hypothetical protein PhCBS80983_g02947 [Powellomyces hirtus]
MSVVSRILLASDVHSKVENVYRMGMWLQQRRIKPDMTISCGDLVNVNHDQHGFASSIPARNSTHSPSTVSQSLRRAADMMAKARKQQEEQEFKAVLEGLRQITPNLYYVPGNHDPAEAFPDFHPARSIPRTAGTQEDGTVSESPLWQRMQTALGAVNFHGRLVRLAPNLLMGGFGGSVPQTLYHHHARVAAHPGYPYSEKDFGSGISDVMRRKRHILPGANVLSNASHKIPTNTDPDTHILVTHCGPAGVGTTDINKTPHEGPNTRLESGSHELQVSMSSPFYQGITEITYNRDGNRRHGRNAEPEGTSPRKKGAISGMLFHVHGHSHSAWGLSHLGSIPIINPGPLRDGRFAIATIEHGYGEGLVQRWALTGVEFATV